MATLRPRVETIKKGFGRPVILVEFAGEGGIQVRAPLQVKKWLTEKVKDWDGKAYWIGDQDRGLEIE